MNKKEIVISGNLETAQLVCDALNQAAWGLTEADFFQKREGEANPQLKRKLEAMRADIADIMEQLRPSNPSKAGERPEHLGLGS